MLAATVTGTDVKATTFTRADTATAARAASVTRAARVTGTRITPEVKSAPRRAFIHVCHRCGVIGHIRKRCFKLLREKHQIAQTYGMKFHNPICYCGVQRHVWRVMVLILVMELIIEG